MTKRKHPRGSQGAATGQRPAGRRPPRPNPPGKRSRDDRPHRAASGGTNALWLFGIHAVKAALANPARTCRRLLATAELAGDPDIAALSGIPAKVLDRAEISEFLAPGTVHQGIAGLFSMLPEADLDSACRLEEGRRNVVVALDQVTDPQNLGAILRSAAAFGARAVIVTKRNAPEATGTVAKAASGALEIVPLVRVVNLSQALGRLADMGYWRLGLDGTAKQTLAETSAGENVALVLGAEGTGLRRLTAEHCDLMARLPISPAMESLNVSVAAAIALYELARA